MRILITICLLTACLAGCSNTLPIVEWEDGYIPYYYTGSFTSDDIQTIESAMTAWESVCGVQFEEVIPRSDAYNIIRVKKSTEWASSVGENNIHNHMYYGDGYDAYSHTLHELGHCLGLLHEHQRPDRDFYVTIVWSNILPEYDYNFYIEDNPLIKESDYAYDFKSIMSYNTQAFSINGEDTIIPVEPIERSEKLSDIDIAKAQAIYGSPLGN